MGYRQKSFWEVFLKGEGILFPPLLLPASWKANVMPGAWATLFEPCEWKPHAKNGRAVGEKMLASLMTLKLPLSF